MGARLERHPRARAPRTRSTARRTRASPRSRSRRARSIASRACGRVASARWDGDGFWIETVGTSRRRRRSDGRTRSTILKVKIRTKSMTDPSYHVSSYHVFMRRRRGIDASVSSVRRGAFTAAAEVDSGAVRAVRRRRWRSTVGSTVGNSRRRRRSGRRRWAGRGTRRRRRRRRTSAVRSARR